MHSNIHAAIHLYSGVTMNPAYGHVGYEEHGLYIPPQRT